MTKFRHLPAAGRAIIVVVAIGVLAIAVVACATSYNAIYRLVGQLGLYGYRINQAFPLMLDAAFLVAELAAILGGIMRAVTHSDEVSQGWPGAAMLLCGLGTIGFNVGHAYLLGGRGDPLTIWRCVVAALPPVLMMVSFQVLIAIVKWVMLHLGRPLNSAAALAPTALPFGMAAPGSYGMFPPHPGYGQVPSPGQQGVPQNGHGELAEPTKRAAVEMYLSRLSPQELGVTTASSVVAALAGQGMAVEETYAGRILGEWRVGQPAPTNVGARAAGEPHPARPWGPAGRPRGAGLRPGGPGVRRPRVPRRSDAHCPAGRGLQLSRAGVPGPGQTPSAAWLATARRSRPGGGGGVVAALAPGQPGPGHRAALRRARPGRRPGGGGAARRPVDRPDRASGAGGPHRWGGWHLVYAPTGLGNRVGLLAGVDWRGRDGLVVAPPSQHASGQRYTWVRPLTAALPEVPAELRRLLASPATARTTLPPAPTPAGHSGGYERAALARERAAVAAAPPGRRNATLNRAAFNLGQLVAARLLEADQVRSVLLAAALEAGNPEAKARSTIESGLRGGAAKPRRWGAGDVA